MEIKNTISISDDIFQRQGAEKSTELSLWNEQIAKGKVTSFKFPDIQAHAGIFMPLLWEKDNSLREQVFFKLADSLRAKNSTVIHYELGKGACLSTNEMKAFIHTLNENQNAQSLSFSFQNFQNAEGLTETIGRQKALTSLNIGNCTLPEDFAVSLFEELKETRYLQNLAFSVEPLSEKSAMALSCMIKELPFLNILTLDHVDLTPGALAILSEGIAKAPSLTTIYIRHNGFLFKDYESLADAVKENGNIIFADVFNASVRRNAYKNKQLLRAYVDSCLTSDRPLTKREIEEGRKKWPAIKDIMETDGKTKQETAFLQNRLYASSAIFPVLEQKKEKIK